MLKTPETTPLQSRGLSLREDKYAGLKVKKPDKIGICASFNGCWQHLATVFLQVWERLSFDLLRIKKLNME